MNAERRFTLVNIGGMTFTNAIESFVVEEAIHGSEHREAFYSLRLGESMLITSPELAEHDVTHYGNGAVVLHHAPCQIIIRTA